MTGKEKCKLLKQIRKEIAESNGIVYLTAECTFEGECRGTCPKCDAEVRYLDDQLQQKAARGEKVSLAGLSLDTYEGVVSPAEDPFLSEDNTPNESTLIDGDLETMGKVALPMTIEELGLSVRAYNCLTRAGIKTVEDLTQMAEKDFVRVRNLGQKSKVEVIQKLHSLGFTLKEYDDDIKLGGVLCDREI